MWCSFRQGFHEMVTVYVVVSYEVVDFSQVN